MGQAHNRTTNYDLLLICVPFSVTAQRDVNYLRWSLLEAPCRSKLA